MYNRNDPRFRRTINQITQNLESANESAQVGLFSFSEHYIKPCFGSIKGCLEPCTDTLFPRDDRSRRRNRTRPRGRAEVNFDFYDDWEEDENDALLALGNEELERLLGEEMPQEPPRQPARQRGMSYGTRNEPRSPLAGRRGGHSTLEPGTDPTVIPNQSYFGFLSKLPFKIGRRGLRYKPSAEGLQDRFAAGKGKSHTGEDSDSEQGSNVRRHRRTRSATQSSGHTTDSYSSRGDIFPSDEEDAVPLDDELTGVLERRITNPDDGSSGKSKNSKHKSPSTQSHSSRSSRKKARRKSSSSTPKSEDSEPQMGEVPAMQDLTIEERKGEAEGEVEKSRGAMQNLASGNGLASGSHDIGDIDDKSEELVSPMSPSELPSAMDTVPDVAIELSTRDGTMPEDDLQMHQAQLDQGTSNTTSESDPRTNQQSNG